MPCTAQGLSHLMDVIRGMGGDAFVNRLIGDPAIRMLLMSYDLVPVDRRLMAEEALDMVRGHLHSHGVDVEILEVVGGVVYVRIHGLGCDDTRQCRRRARSRGGPPGGLRRLPGAGDQGAHRTSRSRSRSAGSGVLTVRCTGTCSIRSPLATVR